MKRNLKRSMDPEADVVRDVAFICVAVLIGLTLSPWLAFGIMVGAYVVRSVLTAEQDRLVREQRHALRMALWTSGDRRR